MTTLLDAELYPLAESWRNCIGERWQVETNLRHLKTTMKMDVLQCETVAGVIKELLMFALVVQPGAAGDAGGGAASGGGGGADQLRRCVALAGGGASGSAVGEVGGQSRPCGPRGAAGEEAAAQVVSADDATARPVA